jgi:twitching motility protein PilI
VTAGAHLYQMLREIEADGLRNAAPLPSRTDESPTWTGLGFLLGGLNAVAELGEVIEILKPPRVTALPRVKDWVLGIANMRGRLIPIVDVQRAADAVSSTLRADRRVLVVEDGDLVVGLVIERSFGMLRFPIDGLEPATAEAPGLLGRYLEGAYRHHGRLYNVVRLRKLIRDDRLLDVAD